MECVPGSARVPVPVQCGLGRRRKLCFQGLQGSPASRRHLWLSEAQRAKSPFSNERLPVPLSLFDAVNREIVRYSVIISKCSKQHLFEGSPIIFFTYYYLIEILKSYFLESKSRYFF